MVSKPNQLKCCGNCTFHGSYEYPFKIFCWYDYGFKDSIKDVFNCCDYFRWKAQRCNCVRDALNRRKEK